MACYTKFLTPADFVDLGMIDMKELLALPDAEKEDVIMQLQVSLKNPDVILQETKDIAIERLERYRNGEIETLSLETYQKNMQDFKRKLKNGD